MPKHELDRPASPPGRGDALPSAKMTGYDIRGPHFCAELAFKILDTFSSFGS